MSRNTKFEGMALIVLTLMLVSVFVLSVNMYDDIAENTKEGAFAVFAENVREFLDENEAVAAFFGFEEELPEATDNTEVDSKAEEYIERYNSIYASAK